MPCSTKLVQRMDLPVGLDYHAFRKAVKGKYNRNKLSAAWKAYKSGATVPSRSYESVVPRAPRKTTPEKSPDQRKAQHITVRGKLGAALAKARAKKAERPAKVEVDEGTYAFWGQNEPEGLTSPFAAPEPHTWYTVKITGPAVITLREPISVGETRQYIKLGDTDLDAIRAQIKNAVYEVRSKDGHTVLRGDEDSSLTLDRLIPQKDAPDLVELSIAPLYTPESASGRIVWAIREWLGHYEYVTRDGRKVRIG